MLRMVNVNETASASENVDVNVRLEVMRNAAKNPHARRHAHDDRGTPRASSFYRRLRRVGLHIGGLYCPRRPFSVYYHRHTHFSFDIYRLLRFASVCHCRRMRCHRDNFAVCPAPSILGGPGARRVIHGLHCVGGQLRHPDDCDTCLYHRGYGISCANLGKESVVALFEEEVTDVIEEEDVARSVRGGTAFCFALRQVYRDSQATGELHPIPQIRRCGVE